MKTRRRWISAALWLIFFVAIVISASDARPQVRGLANIWITLTVLSIVLPWFWFLFLPRVALKLAGGNRDRERLILQRVVNTPFPGAYKIFARFKLGLNSQVAKHYAQAEEVYRSILRDNEDDLDPGLESSVRQHLADTLEALGRPDEATAERQQAGAVLGDTKETSLGLQAQGKLLDREHRYSEAIAIYERALELAPANNRLIRAELMMHIALSAQNVGLPADVVRWSEAAIELDPHGPVGDVARRMAAVGCSNLGRLDDAVRHVTAAVELARSADKRVESQALLADYVMRRGELDQAERMAREADAMLPNQKRMPWVVIGQVERERGRLEQAIQALEHVIMIPGGHIPALNRRGDAAVQKDLAVIHAELGHGDAARALIREAEPEMTVSPKLKVSFDASAALIHALLNEPDLARARMTAAEEGLKTVTDDGTARRASLYLMGRAALRLGEPERAESFLHAYLELSPNPLYLPYVHYHLAECRRRLGDEAGGRALDQKAASAGYGNQWERLARERLAAEGVAVGSD